MGFPGAASHRRGVDHLRAGVRGAPRRGLEDALVGLGPRPLHRDRRRRRPSLLDSTKRRRSSGRCLSSSQLWQSSAGCSFWQRLAPDGTRLTRADALLIQALERSHIHPLWDRYNGSRRFPRARRTRRCTGAGATSSLHRARREGGRDRGRRAPRADPRQPRFRRGERHDAEPDRRIHRPRARRQGGAAPPHRGGNPLLDACRGRLYHRQRPALRDEGGRPRSTPPMCWHGHINEGDRRTVWFDAANMPAICALDASFFEPGSARTSASGTWNRGLRAVPFSG